MDFYKIKEVPNKKVINVSPSFYVGTSKDFMVRGKSFYAIWNDEQKSWSTDEFDVQRLIDQDLDRYIAERQKHTEDVYNPLYLRDFKSNSWKEYRNFIGLMPDTNKQLNTKLIFKSDVVKRTDYSSKRLPYDIQEGPIDCYDELIGTLFNPEEREKLEWAIGAVLTGDSKSIQKFFVLYGEGGTGKSTFLNIVQQLFEGYWVPFDAKSLASNSNQFSTEMFRNDPLVAIQHDGDLSKIADNTKLNSIVSHEFMSVSEKFKPAYSTQALAMLFMGTNSPIMITDSRSGIIRRLIDVYPSGNKVSPRRYHILYEGISFELGAIAHHCAEVYKSLGKNYYSNYKPLGMMYQTDVFYNFVEDCYFTFLDQDGTTLKQAWEMYKTYCTDGDIQYSLPKYKFKSELRSYFKNFEERGRDADGKQVKNIYQGFLLSKFNVAALKVDDEKPSSLVLDSTKSIFDEECASCPAQYATANETPSERWVNCKSTLGELDSSKLHYVQLPENHIVIDFDLKDDDGKKSMEKNLEAASSWPSTYAEFSKSGCGVHLHYIYDGDAKELSRVYADDIEIKVFTGNSSLRRKLSKCNTRPIAHISTGLPLKGGNKVINATAVKSERGLRDMIQRNLSKEFHAGTKPSIDFIWKILDDASKSGLKYDVSDMQTKVLAFAAQSTNQSEYCVKLVSQMKFKSEDPSEDIADNSDGPLVFYDVEVFPNLFIIVWKEEGPDKKPVIMINPSSMEVEKLFSMKLVGFNNRRYDNHILYGRFIGYDNAQLYKLSATLVGKLNSGLFREAYNLSYTDIYDFSSKKQSLKKFEIELGIHHQELGYEWDQPVSEDKWEEVASYCVNDVIATEAVFNARRQDFVARLILSEISGLTPNHTTQQQTAKIIFGNDQRPQDKFIYTDLSEMFPGYSYDPTRTPKSLYKGEEPSEGGYVFAVPGIYTNIALLDVQSMHPTSLINLNAFGPYTENFKQLLDARLAIKHKEYDKAKKMMSGVLEPYLGSTDAAKDLSYALKIVINIVYGLTTASFESKFLDPRNKDNIVAKRGALFMIDLKNAVQEKGFTVVHVKTDSIKIADATTEIIDFVNEFGNKYGYVFEHEATYEKMCLVNDAVYIAKYDWSEGARDIGKWTATGAQFAHPYIFKKLFSHETLEFPDLCETKEVKTAMYLDFNENLPDGEHNYIHVGRVGSFVPIKPGCNGAELLRSKDDKYYAVTRTKGYRWMEAEIVKTNHLEDNIDMIYFNTLLDDAADSIRKFGDFEWFISDDEAPIETPADPIGFDDHPPFLACGKDTCEKCKQLKDDECKLGYDNSEFLIMKGEQ